VPRPLGKISVIGKQSTATAGGDQLIAVEAQGAHGSKQTAVDGAPPAAQGLSRVFHQGQPPGIGHLPQRHPVGGMTKHMHRQHRCQPPACLPVQQLPIAPHRHLLQPLGQCGRIHRQRGGIHIHEVRQRPQMSHRIGRDHEAQGRQEHLIPGPHPHQVQGQPQRHGVPLVTATAWAAPVAEASSCSKRLTHWPAVLTQPVSRQSFT
jgi:hypothetical protein